MVGDKVNTKSQEVLFSYTGPTGNPTGREDRLSGLGGYLNRVSATNYDSEAVHLVHEAPVGKDR